MHEWPLDRRCGAIVAAFAKFTGNTIASARRIGGGDINWDERLWTLDLEDMLGARIPFKSTPLTIEARNLLMPYRQVDGFFGRSSAPQVVHRVEPARRFEDIFLNLIN